ncbi:MAG TPA: ABC transporter ATP-binding protein, partial [Chloroflexota bacterium]|nr:ABC transporter ATP-binding protein [Chloroflexota bacterium]
MAQRQRPTRGGPGGGFDAPPPGGPRALLRAMGYLRAHWRDATSAFVALLIVTATNLVVPQFIRLAIDDGIANRVWATVLLAVGGLVLAAAVRGLFTFLQGFLTERASQGVAYDLRDAMFAQIERLGFSYYDKVETGQLVARLTNDVEQIRQFTGQGVVQLFASFFMLVGCVAVLLAINWRLTIVAVLVIPAILFILIRFVRVIGPMFGRLQQAIGQLNSVLQEDLQGMRVIRAFSRESYEVDRYFAANNDLLDLNLSAIRLLSTNFPLVFLMANLGTLAIVWYGGSEVIGGTLTIGSLIAFNSYLAFLLMPILTIGFLAAGITRAGASSLRVFEVLDASVEIRDAPDARPLPPIRGQVSFEDVHFRYPGSDREILQGVSFSAEPGQTVAILGATGSGKSSLVNLLPRFYDVTGGHIKIDGHDVRSVTLSSLRSQIGIVLQDSLLFSGTVRDNIAYGRPEATQEEVAAAARAAQADDFIRVLPLGYDTVVGERGVGLSGGQRQRVAIARALLVNPRLMILDDSTSSVDAGTEGLIQDALDLLMRGEDRTSFVIAQRISTVRNADLIIVLEGGRVAAQGTHEELLRDSPLYNDILGSQLQA